MEKSSQVITLPTLSLPVNSWAAEGWSSQQQVSIKQIGKLQMKISDIIHIFKSFLFVSFLTFQFQPISTGILEVICPWNQDVCVVFTK